jgi:hypothetical protein
MARVTDPNVVRVYGARRLGDQVGMWMELVRGCTLQEMLQAQGMFAARVAGRTAAQRVRDETARFGLARGRMQLRSGSALPPAFTTWSGGIGKPWRPRARRDDLIRHRSHAIRGRAGVPQSFTAVGES